MALIDKNSKIAVTGGLGFIGSSLIRFLNAEGYTNIDIYERDWEKKWKNSIGLIYNRPIIGQEIDCVVLEMMANKYDVIVHLAADSSTSAPPNSVTWNTNYYIPTRMFEVVNPKTKIVFASSASVYGSEENDFTERVEGLHPINFYAYTKLAVDEHLVREPRENVVSLRFFNVYGSIQEQYKGDMCSVIYRWLTDDITPENPIKLFKSYRPDIKDGMQERDFIHVEDVCKVILAAIKTDKHGIFNVGTGESASYLSIAHKILSLRNIDAPIVFKDMPEELRRQYQYRTQANVNKLRMVMGYTAPMRTVQQGITKTFKEIYQISPRNTLS